MIINFINLVRYLILILFYQLKLGRNLFYLKVYFNLIKNMKYKLPVPVLKNFFKYIFRPFKIGFLKNLILLDLNFRNILIENWFFDWILKIMS